MTTIQLIACVGMIAGLFMVLGISPAEMSDSIFSRLTAAPGSIRADINETTKRKKAGFAACETGLFLYPSIAVRHPHQRQEGGKAPPVREESVHPALASR